MATNVQFAVGDQVRWGAGGPRGTVVSVESKDVDGFENGRWRGHIGLNFGRIPASKTDVVWLRPEVLVPVCGLELLAELAPKPP